MDSEYLFYEETLLGNVEKEKSHSKRDAMVSFIILVISGIAALFLNSLPSNAVSPDPMGWLLLMLLVVLLFIGSLIVFLVSIVFSFLLRKKDSSSNIGRVGVNEEGVALDNNFFPWDSIHSLRLFGAGWMRTARKTGNVYLATQGTYLRDDNRWAYVLQTNNKKFYSLAIRDKDAFEASLQKVGKEQLLTTKEKFVPSSLLVAIFLIIGGTLLFQGNYVAGKNPILQILLPGIGLLLVIASIYYWAKKRL